MRLSTLQFDAVVFILRLLGLDQSLVILFALGWLLVVVVLIVISLLWFLRVLFRVTFQFRKHYVIRVSDGKAGQQASKNSTEQDSSGLRRRKKKEDETDKTGTKGQKSADESKSKLVITPWIKIRFLVVPFLTTIFPIAALLYFGIKPVPFALDTGLNQVLPAAGRLPGAEVLDSDEWRAATQVHQSLNFVSDLHADTLMWTHRGSMLSETGVGHVDVPRLIQGNVALQVFSSVTLIPLPFMSKNNNNYTDVIGLLGMAQHWPVKTWSSYLERALFYAGLLEQYSNESAGKLTFIKTRQDLDEFLERRTTNKHITSGLFSVEGLQCLDGKIESVDRLVEAGMRMAGTSHFTDNLVGGSAHGRDHYGLTAFGRLAIRRMLEKNVMIDLAHASQQLIDDILHLWDEVKSEMESHNPGKRPPPLVVSHTGLKTVCDNVRNIEDRHVRAIAERGGVIGVTFFKFANCGDTLDHILDTVDALVKITGSTDVAALGSDFDGSVSTPIDSSQLVYLTYGLLQRGYSVSDVEKVMGGNVLRVLRESLP